jgi:uncharacterized membrane protein YkvA (DUF1232 family)
MNELTHQNSYTDKGFWKKLKTSALKSGGKAVELGLTLYYTMKDSNTPKWARTVIAGALGYFILPFDTIPDFLPGVGYTDDIAALTIAMATVAFSITDEHKQQAKIVLRKWYFGLID